MLRKVMDKLIAGVRSTFIQGREIVDGVLIENKVVDEARLKGEIILFKVDFEKVYGSADGAYWKLSWRK